jgi:RHS repeat-associated protein
LHGPLARTEIGEHKVHGADYAYTLQGWIKGVNSEKLNSINDIGTDGALNTSNNKHKFVARDAYGYALNYYTDPFASTLDFLPVNNANASSNSYFLGTLTNSSALPTLFNGNISFLSASYLSPDPSQINLTSLASVVNVNKYDPYCFMKNYKYDQLNRISSTSVFAKSINNTNNWIYTNSANLNNEFHEEFSYDQNGNILTLKRDLISGQFDNLTYYYYDDMGISYNPSTAPQNINFTNKLAYVKDVAASGITDIANQPVNNYSYDKIGNLVADATENIKTIEWTVYGKIKKIIPANNSKPQLEFKYDAVGNRISKKVSYSNGSSDVTYYVRDAQGNTMNVYTEKINGNTTYLYNAETSIYGSSRIGVLSTNEILCYLYTNVNTPHLSRIDNPVNRRKLGLKAYELSNHLGNVLAVISDRKLAIDDNADNVADYFLPDMLSATDYYAFGQPMPGRQFNNGNYRYGFNGKEKDDEIKGNGNSLDYGMRIYDSRLGRFLSVDALTKEYPELTPYQFAGNTPIAAADLDGNEPDIKFESGYSSMMIGGEGVDKKVYNEAFNKASGNGGIVVGMAGALVRGFYSLYKLVKDAPAPATPKPGTPAQNPRTPSSQSKVKKTDATQTENQSQTNTQSNGGGRGKNKLEPNPEAEGDHSTFEYDNNGGTYKYETYKKVQNPKGQTFFDKVKRFDGGKPNGEPGAPHNGVETPHVQPKGGATRVPKVEEVPNNPRFDKPK